MKPLTLNASRKMKQTPIGEIPVEWEVRKFGKITRMAEGLVDPRVSPYLDYLHIGPENITGGTGQLNDLRSAKELGLISGKYEFDSASIVYSKIRPNLNKVCLPGFRGICSADAYPIWPVDNSIRSDFLFYFMLSGSFIKQVVEKSMRTGMPKINRADLNSILIPIPEVEEQRIIASILTNWSTATYQLETLVSIKRRLKAGLMQQLLTGKRRFPAFKNEGKWKDYHLGDVLKEVERPIACEDDKPYELISVRRRSGGLFNRETLYGHQILTKNLAMARAGDFLISKMQVVHGASGMVTPEFDGKTISGSYITLVAKDPKVLDMEFFNYLSQMRFMYRLALVSSYGVHIEKMTFNLDDYLRKRIEIPPTIEEQRRIVEVLGDANRELDALERELAALREQKKGLMQKLLTGKIRVKV